MGQFSVGHNTNEFIFYGKSGEVASNRLEEQELSVLSEESWRNKMSAADLRALSPLIYSHINPYGRFDLDMTKRLAIEAKFTLAA